MIPTPRSKKSESQKSSQTDEPVMKRPEASPQAPVCRQYLDRRERRQSCMRLLRGSSHPMGVRPQAAPSVARKVLRSISTRAKPPRTSLRYPQVVRPAEATTRAQSRGVRPSPNRASPRRIGDARRKCHNCISRTEPARDTAGIAQTTLAYRSARRPKRPVHKIAPQCSDIRMLSSLDYETRGPTG